jgi:hypothetical protein
MKKILFFTLLLLLAVSSFADNIHQRYLFIEGSADRDDQFEFFMTNFVIEAVGAGYTITGNKNEAAHTLDFRVGPNTGPDSNQYVVKITLFRNEDGVEVITFDFFFTRLYEVYEYSRALFQNAALYIPVVTAEELSIAQGLYHGWKNKWIYLRASFDYPITFYLLKSNGLVGGSLYEGPFSSPTDFFHIGNEIIAMPGATVGVEFQLLDFFSLELNLQFSMGDTRNNLFINAASGLELKFPIKFDNIMLVPYGTFLYHLNVSSIFSDFPPFALGAGLQLCARAGKRGAFFIDVKYMFSLSDAVMHNPFLAFPPDRQRFTQPPVIHYNRSVIGIGVGYKFGFFDRRN